MTTRICKGCEKEFTTEQHAQKFCSANCRVQYFRRLKTLGTRTFTCELCGEAFESAKKRRFCTPECRLKAERGGKKAKKKPKLSLEKAAKLSREEGLTYGQYFLKYGYEGESRK